MLILLNLNPVLSLSDIHKPSTGSTQTNAHCCLTPVLSPTWPSAVYGWGVVVESLESADLPLIDDSICGSLPVRALNFGQRESFGHEELPVHLSAAREAACGATVMAKGPDRGCASDAPRREVLTVLPVLSGGWPLREWCQQSKTVTCPCCHWLCALFCTFLLHCFHPACFV